MSNINVFGIPKTRNGVWPKRFPPFFCFLSLNPALNTPLQTCVGLLKLHISTLNYWTLHTRRVTAEPVPSVRGVRVSPHRERSVERRETNVWMTQNWAVDLLSTHFNHENTNLMKPSSCRINNKMNPYQKIIIPVISSLIVVSWNDLVFTYSLSCIGSMAIILRKSWSRYAAKMNLTSRFSRRRLWLRSGDCFGKGELLMEGPVLHPCWPVLKCSLEMNFHFCTSGLYGGFADSDHHLTYDFHKNIPINR